jgi:hypothetical protein
MDNEAVRKAIERIKAIDWTISCYDHEGSIVMLFLEYARRSVLWTDALGHTDEGWFMRDIPATISPEWELGEELINPGWELGQEEVDELHQHLNRCGYLIRRLLAYYIQWASIKDRPEVTKFGLPDPYEPIIAMCERGGWYMKQDKVGCGYELCPPRCLVRIHNDRYYRDKPPYTELDLATLDRLDADSQEYDRRLQDSFAESDSFHVIFPEKFLDWQIPEAKSSLYQGIFQAVIDYGVCLDFIPEVTPSP